MARTRLFALVGLACTLAACGGSRPTADETFGDRAGAWGPDGRETLLIAPPADSAGYFAYPAVVNSVAVRPARAIIGPGETVPVEVLIKGAMPDACSALNEVVQSRAGRYVTLTLTMRQPRGEVCATVVRPYRFYVLLDGLFEAGSYTLTLNGAVTPFQIRETVAEVP